MNYVNTEDNIIALATANGLGSIDVVRISGNNLAVLYNKLTKKKKFPRPNTIQKHNIYSFSSNSNELIDNCLLSFFAGPLSFTGQDVIEINCHGGGYVSNNIIKCVCQSTEARMALPGEFLFRAYINNKIDLIQAEAINDMILSESYLHNNKSLENIDGKLSKKIKTIKNTIINLLLIIEHELDFDESEISHVTNGEINKTIKQIIKTIESVTECYFFSKTVRSGLRILILGKPNVGKSSIYNELLGINRSIVADVPGTTRDTIESILEIDGNRVVLIDSAGSWESLDEIEKMGVEKTKSEIENANIVLLVAERIDDMTPFESLVKGKDTIRIMSKSDLHNHPRRVLSVSTENGLGFSKLSTKISTKINKYYTKNRIKNDFLINERQYQILNNCNKQLKLILDSMKSNIQRDILADLLHLLLSEYNNVINPVNRADIINTIFSGFCVGK